MANDFLDLSESDLYNLKCMKEKDLYKIEGLYSSGRISKDFYEEIIGLWVAFKRGITTPDEYCKKRKNYNKNINT